MCMQVYMHETCAYSFSCIPCRGAHSNPLLWFTPFCCQNCYSYSQFNCVLTPLSHTPFTFHCQAREARRHAQASAAADARAVAKKEAEWMSRQPKAREKKSKARQDAFVELTQRARNMPAPDVEVDFGALQMVRQG